MKNIYLSFLGIGSDRKTPGVFNYDKTVYTLDGKTSGQTEFVQVAEIQMLGAHRFDGILIIATQKSFDAHFHRLKAQLNEAGASHVEHIIISEDMSPSGQWSWFEQILDEIDFGAELTLDLTHGYRLIPIVFSAAINFLQKSKNVKINAIYYGAYDSNRECSPIVDMKEFYLINEWADGVSRLVEDADVRKIAETAVKTPQFQVGELNDGNLINAFEDLTSAIRNVDINNISEKTIRTIQLLKEKERGASATGRILLKLVMDKFASLMAYIPTTGLYDANYFRFQLQIIQLLLEHHLFMQAYTVMREFIASLGLIAIQTNGIKTSKGREQRRRFGEAFVCMMQFPEKDWKFSGQGLKDAQTLRPYYDKLKTLGIEPILRDFSKDLAHYRNGFDHAWTMKSGAYPDEQEKGAVFLDKLRLTVHKLEENHFL